MGITVRGLDFLRKEFTSFEDGMHKNVETVMEEAAQRFIETAQDLAPYDLGNLEASIGVLNEGDLNGAGRFMILGVDIDAPGTRTEAAGGTVEPYAEIQEIRVGFLEAAADDANDYIIMRLRQETTSLASRIFGSVGRFFGRIFGRR